MNMLDKKISLLSSIRENKEILFGAFSSLITKQSKEEAWNNIANEAKALCIISADKSWQYVRDTTWQNWRKRAVEKKDKKNKTGKPGGKSLQYDAGDLIVFEILGTNSPILDGLPIPEASGGSLASLSNQKIETQVELETEPLEQVCEENDIPTTATPTSRLLNKKRKNVEVMEEDDLRKKKLKFQIDILQLEKHKRLLEIMELEKAAGLGHSSVVKEFLKEYY